MRCAVLVAIAWLATSSVAHAQDAFGFRLGSTVDEARAACVAAGFRASTFYLLSFHCGGTPSPLPLGIESGLAMLVFDEHTERLVDVSVYPVVGDGAAIEPVFRALLAHYVQQHGHTTWEHWGDLECARRAMREREWGCIVGDGARLVVPWTVGSTRIALTVAHVPGCVVWGSEDATPRASLGLHISAL